MSNTLYTFKAEFTAATKVLKVTASAEVHLGTTLALSKAISQGINPSILLLELTNTFVNHHVNSNLILNVTAELDEQDAGGFTQVQFIERTIIIDLDQDDIGTVDVTPAA